MIERTYVMVKPEFANEPWIIKEVKDRILNAGLYLVCESEVSYDETHADLHYSDYLSKDFYKSLRKYITSDKAYGMIFEGENAIKVVRKLTGATKNPEPGTIRYDIPTKTNSPLRTTENVIHSSDSPEAANKEIKIFISALKKSKNKSLDIVTI